MFLSWRKAAAGKVAVRRTVTLCVLAAGILVMGAAFPALAQAADPLDSWSSVPSGTSWPHDYLVGTAYGNGTFVAVGWNGTVITSPDASSWTGQKSATTADLFRVSYENGAFYATGDEPLVTSADGASWSKVSTGGINVFNGTAYGNGNYAEAGWHGEIRTSKDGKSWTSGNTGTTEHLLAITYAFGKFVAVGANGTILTSPDGGLWASRTSGTTHYLNGICYGNKIFVAVGNNGTILTSPDGVTWTSRASGTTEWLNAVAFGDGTFVAVGENGTVLSSADGMSWTGRTSGTATSLNGICYGNGTFVAVGGNGTVIKTTVASAGTVGTAPAAGPPSAPTGLKAEAVFSDGVELHWNDQSDNETGFEVERKTGSGSFVQIKTGPQDWPQYTDMGLTAGTTYSYRVRAVNASGNSAYSNVLAVTPQGTGQNPGTLPPGSGPGSTSPAGGTTLQFFLGDIFYTVNGAGDEMDAPPVAVDGRTLLPIRYVAEPLGASVDWDASEQKTTVTMGSKVVELWNGRNEASVDGISQLIDAGNPAVTPVIMPPGRTMLPLRFVAEALGCKVDWNGQTKTVTVTY